jgi:hypothetical protein
MTTHLVRFTYDHPPIPVRNFDWRAYLDGYEEDGLYGSGPSKLKAIQDLYQFYEDHFDAPLIAHRPAFLEDIQS